MGGCRSIDVERRYSVLFGIRYCLRAAVHRFALAASPIPMPDPILASYFSCSLPRLAAYIYDPASIPFLTFACYKTIIGQPCTIKVPRPHSSFVEIHPSYRLIFFLITYSTDITPGFLRIYASPVTRTYVLESQFLVLSYYISVCLCLCMSVCLNQYAPSFDFV